jgi:hypothetical protein
MFPDCGHLGCDTGYFLTSYFSVRSGARRDIFYNSHWHGPDYVSPLPAVVLSADLPCNIPTRHQSMSYSSLEDGGRLFLQSVIHPQVNIVSQPINPQTELSFRIFIYFTSTVHETPVLCSEKMFMSTGKRFKKFCTCWTQCKPKLYF